MENVGAKQFRRIAKRITEGNVKKNIALLLTKKKVLIGSLVIITIGSLAYLALNFFNNNDTSNKTITSRYCDLMIGSKIDSKNLVVKEQKTNFVLGDLIYYSVHQKKATRIQAI